MGWVSLRCLALGWGLLARGVLVSHMCFVLGCVFLSLCAMTAYMSNPSHIELILSEKQAPVPKPAEPQSAKKGESQKVTSA